MGGATPAGNRERNYRSTSTDHAPPDRNYQDASHSYYDSNSECGYDSYFLVILVIHSVCTLPGL